MDTLLGISISSESVEAVALEPRAHAMSVKAIGEWKRTPDTGLMALGDRLQSFMDANGIRAKALTVALDTSLLFVHTFPVEAGSTREEWQQHARWERAQFFPTLPQEEFISDVFALPPRPSQQVQNVMSLSIRREDVRSLRSIAQDAGMALGGVDGAHFCAETALLERSSEFQNMRLLFVAVKKQNCEWSLFEQKALVHYESRRAEGAPAVADLLLNAVREHHPDQIILHGPLATREMQDALREATPVPVRVFDPFQGVDLPPELPLSEHFVAASFRFAAAVGAALRGAGEA